MAVFTSAIVATALGVAAGTGTLIAATALNVIAGAVFSLALNKIATAIAGKPDVPRANLGITTQLQFGGDLPRSAILGRTATAGSLVWANHWGKSGNTPNAYLTRVIALSDLPAQSLEGVIVDGEACTLGDTEAIIDGESVGFPVLECRTDGESGGFPDLGPPEDGDDHLWIKFYDGTQTAADPLCVNNAASTDRPYEATRVGVGVTYVVVTALINRKVFQGVPQCVFEVVGAPLYDPSKDGSASGTGAHRWNDPATWGGDGDELPMVIAYNVMRGISYDGEWVYGLQGTSAAQLPAAAWVAEIEKCRATGSYDDATAPRYRAGLEVPWNTEPGDVLEALNTACQGRIGEAGGIFTPLIGDPGTAAYSFADADIIAEEPQSFSPFFGVADSVTGIVATFPDREQAWSTQATPPLYDADAEVADGNRRLIAEVRLDAVWHDEQAQALLATNLAEARRSRRHSFVLPPEAQVLTPNDKVVWTSARNGYTAKAFRVDGVSDLPNLDVRVDITEIDPDDYTWDTGTQYAPIVSGTLVAARPAVQGTVIGVAAAQMNDGSGGARRPAISVSFTPPEDDVAALRVQVRVASTGQVVFDYALEGVESSPQIIGPFLPSTAYEVRGRWVPTARDRAVAWSGWLSVTTSATRLTADDLSANIIDSSKLTQDLLDTIGGSGAAATAAAEAARDAAQAAQTAAETAETDAVQAALDADADRVAAEAAASTATTAAGTATTKAAEASADASSASSAAAVATGLGTGNLVAKGLFEDDETGDWRFGGTLTVSTDAPTGYTRSLSLTAATEENTRLPIGIDGRTYRIRGWGKTLTANPYNTRSLRVGLRGFTQAGNETPALSIYSLATVLAPGQDWTYFDATITVDGGALGDSVEVNPIVTRGTETTDPTVVKVTALRIEDVTQATAAASSAATAETRRDEAEVAAGAAQTAQTQAEAARDAASGSASAASTSASNAGASSTAAGNSATAAQTARTEAEAARDAAQGHATTAQGQASAASTSAATAEAWSEVAASVGSRGVLDNPTFRGWPAGGWARWTGGGSLTVTDQTKAGQVVGTDLAFVVSAAQDDGLSAFMSSAIWVGPKHASAYRVEVELTVTSGSLEDSAVHVFWETAGTVFHTVTTPLFSMRVSGVYGGRQRWTGIFRRPASWPGSPVNGGAQLRINGLAPGAAVQCTLHSMQVFTASAEELAGGEVGAAITAEQTARQVAIADEAAARTLAIDNAISAVQGATSTTIAEVENLTFTQAEVEGFAIATVNSQVSAESGGSIATVRELTGATTSLDGDVRAQRLLTLDANGRVASQFMGAVPDGSEIRYRADRFIVENTANGNGVQPFEVEGGVVYIANARIKNAAIDRVKIANASVSRVARTFITHTATYLLNEWFEVGRYTVVGDASFLVFNLSINLPSSVRQYQIRMLEAGGTPVYNPPATFWTTIGPVGTYAGRYVQRFVTNAPQGAEIVAQVASLSGDLDADFTDLYVQEFMR